MKTVKEVLIKAIKDAGGDGLCNADCGCSVDDLAPCDGMRCDCVLAKSIGRRHGYDSFFMPIEQANDELKEAK